MPNTFLEWVGAVVIVAVALFVLSAMVAGTIDAIKNNRK